jgi:16S rRNA (cytosine967-C5)-methyltransferase
VLGRAATLARPGGRIVYVTCSVMPEENDEVIAGFLAQHHVLARIEPSNVLRAAPPSLPGAVMLTSYGLQMTPRRTGTDGFYVAKIIRQA